MDTVLHVSGDLPEFFRRTGQDFALGFFGEFCDFGSRRYSQGTLVHGMGELVHAMIKNLSCPLQTPLSNM
jgi:hypothetical protein